MRLSHYLRFARVLLLFVACAVYALPSWAVESDEQIIAAFRVKLSSLQHQIIEAGDDVGKVAALQKQMQGLLVEVSSKVTPKTRAALEVTMKVVNPMVEGGIAYTTIVQKHVEAGIFDYTSATSTEIIDRRLKQLAEIERENDKLIKLATTLDKDMENVLSASKLSAAEKAGILSGFQKSMGGRIGAMRAVRTLDSRLYVEVRGIYGQLRDQLGKWSVKEGVLVFADDAQAEAYNARIERINVLSERQTIAQRQSMGIK